MINRKGTEPESKAVIISDILLIVAAIPATLLPLIGFISACIMVRFKGSYQECILKLPAEDQDWGLLHFIRAI